MSREHQFWLAELDVHGNPRLADGSHEDREGAEKAAAVYARLGLGAIKGKRYAVAEVFITELTGQHPPLDEESIQTLNSIGLRPKDKP